MGFSIFVLAYSGLTFFFKFNISFEITINSHLNKSVKFFCSLLNNPRYSSRTMTAEPWVSSKFYFYGYFSMEIKIWYKTNYRVRFQLADRKKTFSLLMSLHWNLRCCCFILIIRCCHNRKNGRSSSILLKRLW